MRVAISPSALLKYRHESFQVCRGYRAISEKVFDECVRPLVLETLRHSFYVHSGRRRLWIHDVYVIFRVEAFQIHENGVEAICVSVAALHQYKGPIQGRFRDAFHILLFCFDVDVVQGQLRVVEIAGVYKERSLVGHVGLYLIPTDIARFHSNTQIAHRRRILGNLV